MFGDNIEAVRKIERLEKLAYVEKKITDENIGLYLDG